MWRRVRDAVADPARRKRRRGRLHPRRHRPGRARPHRHPAVPAGQHAHRPAARRWRSRSPPPRNDPPQREHCSPAGSRRWAPRCCATSPSAVADRRRRPRRLADRPLHRHPPARQHDGPRRAGRHPARPDPARRWPQPPRPGDRPRLDGRPGGHHPNPGGQPVLRLPPAGPVAWAPFWPAPARPPPPRPSPPSSSPGC